MTSRSASRSTDVLFLCFLVAAAVVELAVIALTPLDLAPDEAHYWEWSKRLDWSYYSKGPLIALIIRAGTLVAGDTPLGVRAGAVACLFLFTLCFYITARKIAGAKAALLAAVALRSMLIFVEMGIVMTTDPPAALFWTLSLGFGYAALRSDNPGWWVLSLAALGLAFLAKYTAIILFPAYAGFLLLSRRRHLFSSGFIAGTILMLLTMSPVVWWNANHDWVNFSHNAGHLVKTGSAALKPQYLLELIGGQLGLAGPVFFTGLIYVLYLGAKRWKNGDLLAGYWTASALALAGVCFVLSLTKRIYANWPMPLYISLAFLTLQLVASGSLRKERTMKWWKWGLACNVVLALTAHALMFGYAPITAKLTPERLPTKKLVGWSELGRVVASKTAQIGDKAFVISGNYDVASAVAFYGDLERKSYCANLGERRMNQYDIWGGWEELKHRDAIVVLKDSAEFSLIEPYFEQLVLDEEPLQINYGNWPLRRFYFARGRDYKGAPMARPVAR